MHEPPGAGPKTGLPSLETIRRLLLDKRLAVMPKAGAEAIDPLIGWEGFVDLVTSGKFPAKALDVTRRGARLPSVLFHDKTGVKADSLRQILSTDGSIVAYGVEAFVPALNQLSEGLGDGLGERIEIGLVATVGEGGALKIHFDDSDVLVLQLEGRKRWMIHQTPSQSAFYGKADQPTGPEPGDPLAVDVILESGDALFMPAGHWHHCENAGSRSLHIAIVFWPLSELRILDLLYRAALPSAETRQGVRGDAAERAMQLDAIKARLTAAVSNLSEEALAPVHRRTPVSRGR